MPGVLVADVTLKERYRLVRAIHVREGVETWEALDEKTGARCVVKILSLKGTQAARQWELFDRETKVLKHLAHPRIPACIDAFSVEESGDVRFVLVQQLVEGTDLRTLMRDGKRFTAHEAARILLSASTVLEHIHSLMPPLIHRDIKPANLMLDAQGEVHLVDFGAVKAVLPGEASGNTVVGTYGYMPLEQFEGRAMVQSDIYALGMTAVVLLTGKEPWERDERIPRPSSEELRNVPAGLRRIVEKMTQLAPNKRHRSAEELSRELRAFLDGKPSRALPLGIACAVLGVGVGMFAMRQPPAPPPAVVSTVKPAPLPPPVVTQEMPKRHTLKEGYDCVNRTFARTRDSRNRYLSWVDEARGPTCHERIIYGLYSCYDDSIEKCRHAAEVLPEIPALRELSVVNAELVPLLSSADRYYSDEDYKDDGCKRAQEMHPRLIELFTRAIHANSEVRRQLRDAFIPLLSKPASENPIDRNGMAVMTTGFAWLGAMQSGASQQALQALLATWQPQVEALQVAVHEYEAFMETQRAPSVDPARFQQGAEEARRYADEVQAQARAHGQRLTLLAKWKQFAAVVDGFVRNVKVAQRDAVELERSKEHLIDDFHDRVIAAWPLL